MLVHLLRRSNFPPPTLPVFLFFLCRTFLISFFSFFFGVILSIVMHSIVREVEGDLYILDHELNMDDYE
jgi:hypothetical protein